MRRVAGNAGRAYHIDTVASVEANRIVRNRADRCNNPTPGIVLYVVASDGACLSKDLAPSIFSADIDR